MWLLCFHYFIFVLHNCLTEIPCKLSWPPEWNCSRHDGIRTCNPYCPLGFQPSTSIKLTCNAIHSQLDGDVDNFDCIVDNKYPMRVAVSGAVLLLLAILIPLKTKIKHNILIPFKRHVLDPLGQKAKGNISLPSTEQQSSYHRPSSLFRSSWNKPH